MVKILPFAVVIFTILYLTRMLNALEDNLTPNNDVQSKDSDDDSPTMSPKNPSYERFIRPSAWSEDENGYFKSSFQKTTVNKDQDSLFFGEEFNSWNVMKLFQYAASLLYDMTKNNDGSLNKPTNDEKNKSSIAENKDPLKKSENDVEYEMPNSTNSDAQNESEADENIQKSINNNPLSESSDNESNQPSEDSIVTFNDPEDSNLDKTTDNTTDDTDDTSEEEEVDKDETYNNNNKEDRDEDNNNENEVEDDFVIENDYEKDDNKNENEDKDVEKNNDEDILNENEDVYKSENNYNNTDNTYKNGVEDDFINRKNNKNNQNTQTTVILNESTLESITVSPNFADQQKYSETSYPKSQINNNVLEDAKSPKISKVENPFPEIELTSNEFIDDYINNRMQKLPVRENEQSNNTEIFIPNANSTGNKTVLKVPPTSKNNFEKIPNFLTPLVNENRTDINIPDENYSQTVQNTFTSTSKPTLSTQEDIEGVPINLYPVQQYPYYTDLPNNFATLQKDYNSFIETPMLNFQNNDPSTKVIYSSTPNRNVYDPEITGPFQVLPNKAVPLQNEYYLNDPYANYNFRDVKTPNIPNEKIQQFEQRPLIVSQQDMPFDFQFVPYPVPPISSGEKSVFTNRPAMPVNVQNVENSPLKTESPLNYLNSDNFRYDPTFNSPYNQEFPLINSETSLNKMVPQDQPDTMIPQNQINNIKTLNQQSPTNSMKFQSYFPDRQILFPQNDIEKELPQSEMASRTSPYEIKMKSEIPPLQEESKNTELPLSQNNTNNTKELPGHSFSIAEIKPENEPENGASSPVVPENEPENRASLPIVPENENGVSPPVVRENEPENGASPPVVPENEPDNGASPPVVPENEPDNGASPPVEPENEPENGASPPVVPDNEPDNGASPPVVPENEPENRSSPPIVPENELENGASSPVLPENEPDNGASPPFVTENNTTKFSSPQTKVTSTKNLKNEFRENNNLDEPEKIEQEILNSNPDSNDDEEESDDDDEESDGDEEESDDDDEESDGDKEESDDDEEESDGDKEESDDDDEESDDDDQESNDDEEESNVDEEELNDVEEEPEYDDEESEAYLSDGTTNHEPMQTTQKSLSADAIDATESPTTQSGATPSNQDENITAESPPTFKTQNATVLPNQDKKFNSILEYLYKFSNNPLFAGIKNQERQTS